MVVVAKVRMPLSLLGWFCGRLFVLTFARRTAVTLAITPVLAPITGASPVAVAKAKTAVLALAVAVSFAHHGGRPFLVLIDAHGQIAQHFLVEPLLAFDFLKGGCGRVHIEERKVGFAVLAQAIGKGLH